MGYYIAYQRPRTYVRWATSLGMVLGSIIVLGVVNTLALHPVLADTPNDTCFSFSSGTITDYYNNENNDPMQPACTKDVDIPIQIGGSNVLAIDSAAFAGKSLTAITIPEGVTTIGDYAFAGNSSLSSLAIPNSVISLGSGIVSGSPITTLSIGTPGFSGTPTLTIPNSAFLGVGLTSLTIGNNVAAIDDYSFRLNSLSTIEIPSSVTTIGDFAFNDAGIDTLVLYEGLITISESAFSHNNLTSLVVPDSVTTIEYYAFASNAIEDLNLGEGIQTIGDGVFSSNALVDLVIPNSVTYMGSASFQGNPLRTITIGTADFTGTPQLAIGGQFNGNSVEEVAFGNNVLTISLGGNNAFAGNNITHVTIPSSVTYVGPNSFPGNQIESIIVEDGAGEIAAGAFAGNTLLKTVTIYGDLTFDNNAFNSSGGDSYIQIYAYHPNFVATYGLGFLDNTGTPWGYIVNPATYTVHYRSSNGDILADSFVSGTSPALTNYSISANPTGNFGLYYHGGDTIPLTAPNIASYVTPENHSLTLASGNNTYTFVYATTNSNSSGDELSETGGSHLTIVSIGTILALGGISLALIRSREIL